MIFTISSDNLGNIINKLIIVWRNVSSLKYGLNFTEYYSDETRFQRVNGKQEQHWIATEYKYICARSQKALYNDAFHTGSTQVTKYSVSVNHELERDCGRKRGSGLVDVLLQICM
jgi:hypothetical protein